jgi:hypothetical protein
VRGADDHSAAFWAEPVLLVGAAHNEMGLRSLGSLSKSPRGSFGSCRDVFGRRVKRSLVGSVGADITNRDVCPW